MKNLIILDSKERRELFLQTVWTTDEFRQSFNERGFVWEKTKKFLDHGRLVAEPSDIQIEHSHFYSWMNVLIQKVYENKTVQDLYFLHEIIHITTMPYLPDSSFNDWSYKMVSNETEASIESEVMVYQQLQIRDKSFKFPIWYDELAPKASKLSVLFDRIAAMTYPRTEAEKNMSKYLSQNYQWVSLWDDTRNQVETELSRFYQTGDLTKLVDWLNSVSTDGVPFKEKAVEFSKVYHSNFKLPVKKD